MNHIYLLKNQLNLFTNCCLTRSRAETESNLQTTDFVIYIFFVFLFLFLALICFTDLFTIIYYFSFWCCLYVFFYRLLLKYHHHFHSSHCSIGLPVKYWFCIRYNLSICVMRLAVDRLLLFMFKW